MEKTDTAVINYLEAMKHRLSGNSLKIAFEIVMRWRDSETDWITFTYGELINETKLARGTVISAIREAKTLKAIELKRKGYKFCTRPNFEQVQNLYPLAEKRFENALKQAKPLEITERLFWRWQQIFGADGAKSVFFSRDRRRAARRVLNFETEHARLAAYRNALKALKGYSGSPVWKFEEIFASAESVEKGIVRYEFRRTREDEK